MSGINSTGTPSAMTELKCDICGADLLAGTGFCRQCGAAISGSGRIDPSEQQTAIFPDHDVATQRLRPRPTRPTVSDLGAAKPSAMRRNVFLLVMLIVLLLGIIAAVAVLSDRHLGSSSNSVALYPGATTVMDMNHPDGGRTVQLQTADPLDRVESWYQHSMSLDKTVRLTSKSVVLKNQKVSITLVAEDNKTNILIKQSP
jgi:hypothetical protein